MQASRTNPRKARVAARMRLERRLVLALAGVWLVFLLVVCIRLVREPGEAKHAPEAFLEHQPHSGASGHSSGGGGDDRSSSRSSGSRKSGGSGSRSGSGGGGSALEKTSSKKGRALWWFAPFLSGKLFCKRAAGNALAYTALLALLLVDPQADPMCLWGMVLARRRLQLRGSGVRHWPPSCWLGAS